VPPTSRSELMDALDQHVEILKSLVELSQREHQQLIAFEPGPLSATTETKSEVAEALSNSESRLRATLEVVAMDAGYPKDQELVLSQVLELVMGPERDALMSRATLLRSLAESLSELQAISLLHAERGLKAVRAYTSLLRSHNEEEEEGDRYTSQGRPRRIPLPTSTLTRNV
jgi:flagellar biosynthesis/type III secretory pathway chaperone